jgi:hypothetical protein
MEQKVSSPRTHTATAASILGRFADRNVVDHPYNSPKREQDEQPTRLDRGTVGMCRGDVHAAMSGQCRLAV